jgi:hypothetical protein
MNPKPADQRSAPTRPARLPDDDWSKAGSKSPDDFPDAEVQSARRDRPSDATMSQPASPGEVTGIVGELDDATIARIIETGASSAEILEAFTWLTADDQIGTETKRSRGGRVGQVYVILADALQPYEG